MNKIVRENYPVSKLPEDLREGLDPSGTVRIEVTDEERAPERPPERRPTLDEIWARRRPPFRTKEDIDAQIRADRDAWDD
ncbi:hypothetical protein A33M_3454 [Rhodovulum sp. PH10]|uniref:hypothetical protein n=1 Tax=Rhodovulum sp. PH10 TaxID=1187851 RepID=UPI00027C2B94|nr:hypothetical protein [Rhodovulum sp. PH10]EJW11193.1 hypothetical protein A33M_3454 [Rhodovulum sp. PH10]